MSLQKNELKNGMLNIGCGNRIHPAWTNIDFFSNAPEVVAWDLRKGIPFPDASFEVVYHSHVLEHFQRREGGGLMRECFRVLKPGGVLRVAVPDLEAIARQYLASLEEALAGSENGAANHEWMTLELYDQAVRTQPGGEILKYLGAGKLPNEAFILKRWGNEATPLIESLRNQSAQPSKAASPLKKSLRRAARFLCRPGCVREAFARLFLGTDYALLELGRFRSGGSIHQWMYDRVSLAALFQACGFVEIRPCGAAESCVRDWAAFHLDTEPDGAVYKPDSLFMEGRKPALPDPAFRAHEETPCPG
jgi:SAM-dependent methyltransferase